MNAPTQPSHKGKSFSLSLCEGLKEGTKIYLADQTHGKNE